MKALAMLMMLPLLVTSRAALAQGGPPSDSTDADRALRIAAEVERIAGERRLWPGFDPGAIPLAIYTGEHTYLFRHPSPPPEFAEPVTADSRGRLMPGRHPAVTANTSVDIGGVRTATLLADGERAQRSTIELAAIAIHEAFHVHQQARYPWWAANEGDLFLYPTDDAALLALRRLESAALRRALSASSADHSICSARLALGFRNERFAAMDVAFSLYERMTELYEGLATYVQRLAQGDTAVGIPPAGFPAADVRTRAYVTGPAFAFLLDRLSPGWQESMLSADTIYLDQILDRAVGADERDRRSECAFARNEIEAIERTARQDAAAVIAGRTERRRQFDSQPGWRVVVEVSGGEPLWPQGFDPLNFHRVDGGVLHTRLLRVGNRSGQLQIVDESGAAPQALTEGVGPHPLFNGIRRVTIAALPEPEVRTEGQRVVISAAGLEAEFTGVTVQSSGTELRVVLGSAPSPR